MGAMKLFPLSIRKLTGFFLLALALAAIAADDAAPQAVNPASYDHPVRVACLGDSITMGGGTFHPATESYPAQLQALLGAKWEVTNYGVGGRTLLRKQDPYSIGAALKAKPDVIVMMLGTNDSRQTTWDAHGADFVGDYTMLLGQLRALDSHPKIWIGLPTPMFPGRWNLSEDILTAKTIPAIKQVAEQNHTGLIDLHAPFVDQKADFLDTVHPDAKICHQIAVIVAATLTGSAAK